MGNPGEHPGWGSVGYSDMGWAFGEFPMSPTWTKGLITEMRKHLSDQVVNKALQEIRFPATPIILGTSVKVEKSTKFGVLTGVIYLTPSVGARKYGVKTNLCPFASPACKAECLRWNSSRLQMYDPVNAGYWKTLLWEYDRPLYRSLLRNEVKRHIVRAQELDLIPAIRTDGTSDIGIPRRFPQMFPDVSWYNYTKNPHRMGTFLNGQMPDNVHLVFSRSETNIDYCMRVLQRRGTVACVFEDLHLAVKTGYMGYPVIDGDLHDYRPNDERASWIGLSPKGKMAKADKRGFVVRKI
jgi:hypothetical protein